VIYLDTSWLVKLYVDESDSAAIRSVVAADPDVVVSDVAYVEFHSALCRRRRERLLSARAAASLSEMFEADWVQRVRVAISREVLLRARALLAAHAVRTLDAIQLGSALLLAEGAPDAPKFGAADAKLIAAAVASGLRTPTLTN
jgi:uncharacterized protein